MHQAAGFDRLIFCSDMQDSKFKSCIKMNRIFLNCSNIADVSSFLKNFC